MGKDLSLRQKLKRRLRGNLQPGYSIQYHSRAFNKPLSCQVGHHQFVTKFTTQGVPYLICGKCGAGIAKGIYEKTWSKRDLERIGKIGVRKERTKKQIYLDALKKREEARQERINESIRRIVKKRMENLD